MSTRLGVAIKEVAEVIDALQLKDKQPMGLYEPMDYLLSHGGKRIRPLITLLTYRAFAGEKEWSKLVPVMQAVELFHNFTLLHDDVMDDAPIRRGVPTVYKKYGTSQAILSGDGMLIEAYHCIASVETRYIPELLRRFNAMGTAVCEGQQYDTEYESVPLAEMSVARYMDMIRLKTSHLFLGAAALGAIMADAPQESVERISKAIDLMGLAFQIKDDWLDIYGEPKFGKSKGGDILEAKKTWMLIRTYEQSPAEVIRILELQEDTAKITQMTELYTQLGVGDEAMAEVQRLTTLAQESLRALALPSSAIEPFSELFDQLLNRNL